LSSETSSMVTCALCGFERRRLGAHLKAEHYMTVEEYQSRHPGALVDAPGSRVRSPECRAKMAEAARRRWQKPEEIQAQSERLKITAPWKGKLLSDEHKKAISAGGKGVPHRLTDERRRELSSQRRVFLRGILADPGYHAKQGARMRLRALRERANFSLRRPEVKAKSLASRIRNGTLIPPGGGRGVTGFRAGISHYCRSTLEANFARVLILEGIPYKYEPKVFMLPSGQRWTPDFYLEHPLEDLVPAGWVELKGWRMPDGSLPGDAEGKLAEFKQVTGERVFVLCQQDDLWSHIKDVYSHQVLWEHGHRNLRTHPSVFGVPAPKETVV